MSLRASASLPSSCSGAMYWKVPRIVPSAVSARPTVGDCASVTDDEPPRGAAQARRARQPEVHELGPAAGEHDVAGLEVAVHDARAMGAIERVGDLRAQAQRLGRRERAAREARVERVALDQLEDEVIDVALLADVVERADVRVVEARDRLRLALEAGADLGLVRKVRRQDLHGDVAAEAGVLRAVDLAHAAGAQRREDFVGTESGSGGQEHPGNLA